MFPTARFSIVAAGFHFAVTNLRENDALVQINAANAILLYITLDVPYGDLEEKPSDTGDHQHSCMLDIGEVFPEVFPQLT